MVDGGREGFVEELVLELIFEDCFYGFCGVYGGWSERDACQYRCFFIIFFFQRGLDLFIQGNFFMVQGLGFFGSLYREFGFYFLEEISFFFFIQDWRMRERELQSLGISCRVNSYVVFLERAFQCIEWVGFLFWIKVFMWFLKIQLEIGVVFVFLLFGFFNRDGGIEVCLYQLFENYGRKSYNCGDQRVVLIY